MLGVNRRTGPPGGTVSRVRSIPIGKNAPPFKLSLMNRNALLQFIEPIQHDIYLVGVGRRSLGLLGRD